MNERILVIEDDPIALRFIQYTLQQEGYQVLTATDGLAGIRKAQNEKPDLIVLDIVLPGIDGFEICHRLRAEPQTAQLPVLMISTWAQEIDKATDLKVGATDYLAKPFEPSEIVSRLETLLAQKTVAKSQIITFLGSKGGAGTTTMVANTAIALSQTGKQVIVLDLRPEAGNIAEHLGLKPECTIAELLAKPIDSIDRCDPEAALVVHHTGVRVLAIPQPAGEHKEVPLSDVDLLFERLREVTDYLLVDLLFQPSDVTRAVLTKCDLIIMVTDSKADALPSVKHTAALVRLLGISQERMGAVVVDREGMFSEWELSKIKPTVELNIGVSLLGIIPYDTKTFFELVAGSSPVILSNPNCPTAWAIRGVAQHIMGEKINNKDSSQARDKEHEQR